MEEFALGGSRIVNLMENSPTLECCHQLVLVDEAPILRRSILFDTLFVVKYIHVVEIALNARVIVNKLDIVIVVVPGHRAARLLFLAHF